MADTHAHPRAVRWHAFDTPMGRMHVACTDRGLCRLTWRTRESHEFEEELALTFPGRPIVHDPDGLLEVQREIQEYCAGLRKTFDLPVDLSALGAFERRVLETTRHVSFGSTAAYSELARSVGNARAARAVGNALRRNPVPIVVPCHRVIRADGSLGGYGGRDEPGEKERLLRLETRV